MGHAAGCGPFLCLALVACGSNDSLAGTYRFSASSVVTNNNDDETCGRPGLPRAGYQANFLVTETSTTSAVVTELINECKFEATVAGAMVSAADVECVIAENAAVRRDWGLSRELIRSFSIDAERGLLRAAMEHWWEVNAGSGHSCAVVEGRLASFVGADE